MHYGQAVSDGDRAPVDEGSEAISQFFGGVVKMTSILIATLVVQNSNTAKEREKGGQVGEPM